VTLTTENLIDWSLDYAKRLIKYHIKITSVVFE